MPSTSETRPRRSSARWPIPQKREAVALSYDPQRDIAPRVVARGRGHLADAIVAKAKEHGVAVVSDQVALDALRFVDVGKSVPPQVYRLIAEILAFVYNLGEQPKHRP